MIYKFRKWQVCAKRLKYMQGLNYKINNSDEERLLLKLQRDENAALVIRSCESLRCKKMFPKTFLSALRCLSALLMNALTFSFQFLVHPTGIGDTTENTIINREDISKAIFN